MLQTCLLQWDHYMQSTSFWTGFYSEHPRGAQSLWPLSSQMDTCTLLTLPSPVQPSPALPCNQGTGLGGRTWWAVGTPICLMAGPTWGLRVPTTHTQPCSDPPKPIAGLCIEVRHYRGSWNHQDLVLHLYPNSLPFKSHDLTKIAHMLSWTAGL